MGIAARRYSLKKSFRFGLSVGVCLCVALPAIAQKSFDPFAPNVVAPTEPGVLPTAPTPVAPKLPPRPIKIIGPTPQPVPAPVVEPIVQAPLPKPVTSTPATVTNTGAVTPVEPGNDTSFFEKLNDLFSDKNDVKPEPKTKVEQPVAKEIVEPAAPKIDPTPVEKSKQPKPNPIQVTKPVPEAEPVRIDDTPTPYTVAADPHNSDPFAPSSVAPALPMDAPQAPAIAPIIVKSPAPEPVSEPVAQEIRTVEIESEPTPEAAQAQAPELSQEMAETKTVSEPSFFEKLGNIFSSPAQQKTSPVETVTPEPMAEPEPVEVQIVEEIITTPTPNTVTEVVESTPAAKGEERGIGDFFSDLFKSDPNKTTTLDPVEKVIEQPAALTKEIVQPTPVVETPPQVTFSPAEPTLQAEPFSKQAIAPSIPVDTPVAEQQLETVKTKPSKGLLETLDDILKSDDTPKPELVKPAAAPAPVIKPDPIIVEAKTPIEPSPPIVAEVKDEGPGLFDRIGNFFNETFTAEEKVTDDLQKEELIVVEEEATPVIGPVQKAEPTPPKPKPIDPRLAKAELGLGRLIKLGQGDDDLSPKAKCFTKNRGTVAYCVTPTDWPSTISSHFEVSSHLYKGAQGIVQFDGNIATRIFGLFNVAGFDDIVKYYEKNLGPATNQFMRKTRTIRLGTLENPTYIWHKENPDDGLTEIIELRKIADTRGSIPDMQRGSVRVYFEGARDIFALTSDLDYMSLR